MQYHVFLHISCYVAEIWNTFRTVHGDTPEAMQTVNPHGQEERGTLHQVPLGSSLVQFNPKPLLCKKRYVELSEGEGPNTKDLRFIGSTVCWSTFLPQLGTTEVKSVKSFKSVKYFVID